MCHLLVTASHKIQVRFFQVWKLTLILSASFCVFYMDCFISSGEKSVTSCSLTYTVNTLAHDLGKEYEPEDIVVCVFGIK